MSDSTPSFAADINPLFRESDREAMRVAFDLWSFELLRRWIDAGKPE